jgi:hypothetical protein
MSSITSISKDGQDWLVLALDPFHDLQRPIEGLPDEMSSSSFVRCHVQSTTLSANAEGDKFRVVFTGYHGPQSARNIVTSADNLSTFGVGGFETAPIIVHKATAAQEPAFSSVGAAYLKLGTTPDSTTASRLVAIGLELTDITQVYNKQGTLAAARCTGPTDWVAMATQYSEGEWSHPHFAREPGFPKTKALASLTPGYLEWEARKGVYVTPRFQKPEFPSRFYSDGQTDASLNNDEHLFMMQEIQAESNVWKLFSRYDRTSEIGHFALPGLVHSGFEPCCIFLEGLDASSTFRLVVRTYVEYFPDVSSAVAISSTSPSPSYDPLAFRAYHEAAIRLPIGVPVSMNEKGDWWKMVKGTLGTVTKLGVSMAPSLLTMAGQPELALAASALQKGYQAAREHRRSPAAIGQPPVAKKAAPKRK